MNQRYSQNSKGVNLMVRNVTRIKNRACEQFDIWNPIACACECVKDCEIGEYTVNI